MTEATFQPHAIRRLSSGELHLYEAHLCRLAPSDRYLRFGYQITDEQIHRYVASQFRTRSIVLAHFDSSLNVVAAMEVVFSSSKYHVTNEMAEIGLSVEEGYRGKGLGSTLFRRSLVLARNRGVKTMVSHCLAENRFMMRIAKTQGMTVVCEGSDATGTMDVGSLDMNSIMQEYLGEGMGMWDYHAVKAPLQFNYAEFMLNKRMN